MKGKFKLKWVKFNSKGFMVGYFITGITEYHSYEEAGFQAILFQAVFQQNRYYIEPL